MNGWFFAEFGCTYLEVELSAIVYLVTSLSDERVGEYFSPIASKDKDSI
jgi:hypothetical protein